MMVLIDHEREEKGIDCRIVHCDGIDYGSIMMQVTIQVTHHGSRGLTIADHDSKGIDGVDWDRSQ